MQFSVYIIDTETTGLDPVKNEVIEVSMYRMNDDIQKTWCVKPVNLDSIEKEALQVNNHKLEDILHKTEEGKIRYKEASVVIPQIENWIMEDCYSPGERVFVGQNCNFDYQMLKSLWDRNNSEKTFPFGTRPLLIDTIQVELFLNLCKNEKNKFYNLSSLVEKYGVKKDKAHSADGDVRMTVDLLKKQISCFNSNDQNIIRGRK